jgi:hypothetical protein
VPAAPVGVLAASVVRELAEIRLRTGAASALTSPSPGPEVDQESARLFPGIRRTGGPSWLTFLGHMKDSLWSVDLFRCESATLRTHRLVVMDQYTRKIIGFGMHAGSYVDPNPRRNYVEQWNINVQREITPKQLPPLSRISTRGSTSIRTRSREPPSRRVPDYPDHSIQRRLVGAPLVC